MQVLLDYASVPGRNAWCLGVPCVLQKCGIHRKKTLGVVLWEYAESCRKKSLAFLEYANCLQKERCGSSRVCELDPERQAFRLTTLADSRCS